MPPTLAQSGTSVAGNGTYTDPTDPPPGIIGVNGTRFELTLQVLPQPYMGGTVDANRAPMPYSGTMGSNSMNGTLSGGGPPAMTGLIASFTKQ